MNLCCWYALFILYSVLGIPREANLKEIQKAYHSLARRYHPDKNPYTKDTSTWDDILKAYETLSDPELKEAYDIKVHQPKPKETAFFQTRKAEMKAQYEKYKVEVEAKLQELQKQREKAQKKFEPEREEEMKKIEKIQSKVKQVKLNLSCNNKIKQEFPQNSFESWNEVHDFLNEKSTQINSKLNEKQNVALQNQKDIQTYEMELKDIEHQLQQLQSRKKEIEKNLLPKAKQSQRSFEESFKQIKNNQKILAEMCFDASTFCKNENEMNQELSDLFKQKQFEEFDCFEISKCLWKMDLTKYQSIFELNQINGSVVSAVEAGLWKQLGIERQDFCCFSYHIKMMKSAGYSKTFSPDYDHDCCVCSHNTPEKTIHLLKEYEIPIEDDFILKNNYTAPILISKIFLKDFLRMDSSQKGIQIMLELEKWKKVHKSHLKDLNKK